MTLIRELVRPRGKAKAETGIGAAMLTFDPKLFGRERDHRAAAARAQELGIANSWIRGCERKISGLFAGADFDIIDPRTEEELPDTHPVMQLLEKPYRTEKGDPQTATPKTGRGLRNVTSRHMGLSGGAFWYLSQTEALGGTPLELLYINPARMEPATNREGQMVGWIMDKGGRNPVGFELDEIIYFPLEDPDSGFLSVGLVESALSSSDLLRLTTRQASDMLATGGRLAGIFAPKEGQMSDSVFTSVTRDLRTITEMPDSAKRSYVMKGAVEFTPTSVSPTDLDLVALNEMGRDALLALWGVPLSQLGGATAAGLNSGERPKFDEATLWDSVGARLDVFEEVLQSQLLDRFEPILGFAPRLRVERPTFDDDMPMYEMAKAAINQPMTTAERRALIGLPPTGDQALDDAVMWYIPGGRSLVQEMSGPVDLKLTGPPVGGQATTEAIPETLGKARSTKASDDLERLLATASPRLKRALSKFQGEQRARVIKALEERAAHIANKPGDADAYFDLSAENRALTEVLERELVDAAEGTARRITAVGQVLEAVRERATARTAERVTLINETTRKSIRDLVVQGLREGQSPARLGTILRDVVEPLPGDLNALEPVRKGAEQAFASELRAETIARTELMQAANRGALDSYQELDVKQVEASDGGGDPECAARDGRVFTLEEAAFETEQEHPNGTLTWIPVTDFGPPATEGKAAPIVVSPNINVTMPEPPVTMVTMPEHPANIINVDVPPTVVNVEPAHIPAPVVNVAAAEAPVVNVAAPDVHADVHVETPKGKADDVSPVFVVNMPKGKHAVVERDASGRITGARTE